MRSEIFLQLKLQIVAAYCYVIKNTGCLCRDAMLYFSTPGSSDWRSVG